MASRFVLYLVYLETTNKFLYRPGKTYQYEFESDITTTIAGTSSEKSTLHMRALAQLETVSTCEMVLKVRRLSSLYLLYRPKPIYCNYSVVHYSGFSRIYMSTLNGFKPNLQA